MMKTFRLFSIAALALAMAACSSEENTLETQSPAANGKLHFTATIATPGNGSGTRTEYSEQTDGTINVAWKENDKIAAIVINSENKYVKTELTVSKVNTDGSAVISGDIAKPKDDALKVDLIYPASIVTIDDHGILCVSYDKISNGTLDGTLKSIYENIDYRRADGCALTVSGDKATLTSAAKLESKLSIWKLTLEKEDNSSLSASKVAIVGGAGVMASATLATAGSTAYLPVLAATGNICISATTADNDYFYMKEGVALEAKKYYQSTVQMTKGAHLAFLSADYEAKDGETLTGALAADATTKIKIADNAIVTLKDVTINGTNVDDIAYKHAGITCDGDATIKLEGTNTVKGFHEKSPGISVPDGNTLTIQGTGSLTASSNGKAAGIGGGYATSCGNITISGGTVIATGGYGCAGIGSGYQSYSCGNITISGGTVNATGGEYAAGIGSGYWNNVSGTINITSGVTKVTATKGTNAPNSIGKGDSSPDISVTIGGTVYASGISESPFEYSPIPATAHELSASIVGDVVGSNGKAYTLDATHVLPSGVTAVAMVAYLGNDAETSPTNTAFKNGLALALEDVSDKKAWCSQKSATCLGTQYDNSTKFNDLAGIANTDALVGHNSHTHDAASAARNYNSGTHPAGTSAWFLPSAGQWNKMIGSTGLGLSNLGLVANVSYWSSTEDGASSAWGFNSYNGYWANSGSDKDVVFQVRACLAF